MTHLQSELAEKIIEFAKIHDERLDRNLLTPDLLDLQHMDYHNANNFIDDTVNAMVRDGMIERTQHGNNKNIYYLKVLRLNRKTSAPTKAAIKMLKDIVIALLIGLLVALLTYLFKWN